MNTTPLFTVQPTSLVVGLIVGLTVGFTVGFVVALRSRKPENKVTELQLIAFLSMFIYIFGSYLFTKDVSWVVVVAILATGYGVKGGEILEQLLERGKK